MDYIHMLNYCGLLCLVIIFNIISYNSHIITIAILYNILTVYPSFSTVHTFYCWYPSLKIVLISSFVSSDKGSSNCFLSQIIIYTNTSSNSKNDVIFFALFQGILKYLFLSCPMLIIMHVLLQ